MYPKHFNLQYVKRLTSIFKDSKFQPHKIILVITAEVEKPSI